MTRPTAPAILAQWPAPFETLFTRPTWQNPLLLLAGTIPAPGRRTGTSALSILDLREVAGFTNFHRVLNRSRWPTCAAAKRLLHLLLRAFVPSGPVIIGIDETIERRWGPKIKARGIYRDPVRSSRGHFVKASGLRWITVMLLAPIPWVGRVRALPFLTALAPSERFAREQGRRHKKLNRLGASAPPAGCPLAARAPRDRGRRQQLRRHRAARGRPSSPDRDHPASARRPVVRSAPVAAAGHDGPTARVGRTPAHPGRAPDGSQDPPAARHGRGLVWPDGTADRADLGHGALVPPRQAGADPLAAGAGCHG
jgi:hypothetical protein